MKTSSPHTPFKFYIAALCSCFLVFPAVHAGMTDAENAGKSSSSSSKSSSSSSGKSSSSSSSRSSGNSNSPNAGGGMSGRSNVGSSERNSNGSTGGYGRSNSDSRSDRSERTGSSGNRNSPNAGGGMSGRNNVGSSERNSNGSTGRQGMSASEARASAERDIGTVKSMRSADPLSREIKSKMSEINAMGNGAVGSNFAAAVKNATPPVSGQNLKSVTNNFGGVAVVDDAKSGPTVTAAKALAEANANTAKAQTPKAATPDNTPKTGGDTKANTDELLGPVNPVTAITTALPSLEDFLSGKVKITAPKTPLVPSEGSDNCTVSRTLVNGVEKMRKLCNCSKKTIVENKVQKTVTVCK